MGQKSPPHKPNDRELGRSAGLVSIPRANLQQWWHETSDARRSNLIFMNRWNVARYHVCDDERHSRLACLKNTQCKWTIETGECISSAYSAITKWLSREQTSYILEILLFEQWWAIVNLRREKKALKGSEISKKVFLRNQWAKIFSNRESKHRYHSYNQ